MEYGRNDTQNKVERGKGKGRPRSEGGKGETTRARDANKPLHEARAMGGSNASS